jgi:general secretion pathway protein G
MTMKSSKPFSSRRQSGFTLIEIMIVVGIIAVIAGVVAANVFGEGDRAKARLAGSQLQSIAAKIESYELDTGTLPQSLEDLLRQPANARGWLGPYYRNEKDISDPWGNRLEMRVPGQSGNKFDLISYGADKKPGGDGVKADIIHEG